MRASSGRLKKAGSRSADLRMPFRSFASERFWQLYSELPAEVQRLADKQYELFRKDPFHPSLHLKQVWEVRTTRIGHSRRVIGYAAARHIASFRRKMK